MKSIFFSFLIIAFSLNSLCQEVESPSSLAQDENFINWVRCGTVNEWFVQTDLKTQLGDRLNEFRQAITVAESDEDVNNIIAKFGYDPEPGDQKMAEHITYGLYFKQENPALWRLVPEQRTKLIKAAYYEGMSSSDPRWVALKSDLTRLVQIHCGTNARMPTTEEIIDCFWETLNEMVNVVGGFTSIINAINEGNWSATVSAVKKVIKSVGRRLGWVGLAIAAIDIAICLF